MPVTLNGTNGLTFNDGSSQATSPFVGGFGFRNRIINGDMRIDQRNNGASGTAAVYTVDRWGYYQSQTSRFTWQQNAGSVTPPAGFTNYLGFTSSGANTPISSDFFIVAQPIEGFNTADFGWGTAGAQSVTLSFWVRSSLIGTHSGSLRNGTGARSYPFTFTVSASNTWELKTVTIPGDTTGTWNTTNSGGIVVGFNLGAGSTFQSTAGSWAAGNFTAASGSVNVVGTNGATFYITGVQLEKGSTATSFDYRPYGTELQLCQRYYELMGVLLSNAGANIITAYPKVSKRASPTLTVTPASGTGGAFSISGTPTNEPGSAGYYQSSNHSVIAGATLAAAIEL